MENKLELNTNIDKEEAKRIAHLLGFNRGIKLNKTALNVEGNGKVSYLLNPLQSYITDLNEPDSSYFNNILKSIKNQVDIEENNAEIKSMEDDRSFTIHISGHDYAGGIYKGYYFETNRGRREVSSEARAEIDTINHYAIQPTETTVVLAPAPKSKRLAYSPESEKLLKTIQQVKTYGVRHEVDLEIKDQSWGTCGFVNAKSSVCAKLYLLHLETLLKEKGESVNLPTDLMNLSRLELKKDLNEQQKESLNILKLQAKKYAQEKYKDFTKRLRDQAVNELVEKIKSYDTNNASIYGQVVLGYLQAHHGQAFSRKGNLRSDVHRNVELSRANALLNAINNNPNLRLYVINDPEFQNVLGLLNYNHQEMKSEAQSLKELRPPLPSAPQKKGSKSNPPKSQTKETFKTKPVMEKPIANEPLPEDTLLKILENTNSFKPDSKLIRIRGELHKKINLYLNDYEKSEIALKSIQREKLNAISEKDPEKRSQRIQIFSEQEDEAVALLKIQEGKIEYCKELLWMSINELLKKNHIKDAIEYFQTDILNDRAPYVDNFIKKLRAITDSSREVKTAIKCLGNLESLKGQIKILEKNVAIDLSKREELNKAKDKYDSAKREISAKYYKELANLVKNEESPNERKFPSSTSLKKEATQGNPVKKLPISTSKNLTKEVSPTSKAKVVPVKSSLPITNNPKKKSVVQQTPTEKTSPSITKPLQKPVKTSSPITDVPLNEGKKEIPPCITFLYQHQISKPKPVDDQYFNSFTNYILEHCGTLSALSSSEIVGLEVDHGFIDLVQIVSIANRASSLEPEKQADFIKDSLKQDWKSVLESEFQKRLNKFEDIIRKLETKNKNIM